MVVAIGKAIAGTGAEHEAPIVGDLIPAGLSGEEKSTGNAVKRESDGRRGRTRQIQR